MKITPDIMNALEQSIEHHGNVTQFAKYLGIAHSTILFWLSGKTTEINGRIWAQKIRPALQPFLDQDSTGGYPAFDVARNDSPCREKTTVITLDQMTELDTSIEPIQEFINRMDTCQEFLFSTQSQPSFFGVAFDVVTLPFLLAILVAGGEYPKNNDIVLAKIRGDGQIVVGKFERTCDEINIRILFLPGNESISWNPREQPGFLCWIFPVVEIQADLQGELFRN